MSAQIARAPPVPFVWTQTVAIVPSKPSRLVGKHVAGVLQPDCAAASHPSPGTQTFVAQQYCPETVHCVMPSGFRVLEIRSDRELKHAAPHLPQLARSLITSTR